MKLNYMPTRLMQPTDFDAICTLWQEIDVQPEEIIKDKADFQLMLELNPSTCFVAEENGAKRVLINVDLNNLPVAAFYQKYGYREINDCITMGKNL